jgi:hypothetical protein
VKTFWIIVSGASGMLAVFFVLREDYEMAFVAAAAGAVCWILNYRQQLRERLPKEEAEEDEENE